jgi:hypothetical protein
VTGWTAPDRDTLRRIIFQLQRPDWHLRAPTDGADGTWHASNGTTGLTGLTGLTADSLAALMDELDWFHAT